MSPRSPLFPFGVVLEGSSQRALKVVTEGSVEVRREQSHLHWLLVLYMREPVIPRRSLQELAGVPRLAALHSIPPEEEPLDQITSQGQIDLDGERHPVQIGLGDEDDHLGKPDWCAWTRVSLARDREAEICSVHLAGLDGAVLPQQWKRSPSKTAYEARTRFLGIP